jgi:hypothetical protein
VELSLLYPMHLQMVVLKNVKSVLPLPFTCAVPPARLRPVLIEGSSVNF